MMDRYLKTTFAVAVAFMSLTGVAIADSDSTSSSPSDGIHGLQVLAGVLTNFDGDKSTNEYDKVLYKGTMITSHGQQATTADLNNQFIASDPQAANTPNVQFDLAHGTGSVNDDVLNAFGVNKLTIPTVNLYPFSTILRGDALLNGKEADAAFNIEAPSWHPFTGLANWLILGTGVERQWQSKSLGPSQTTGLVTFRGFIGKCSWVKTARSPFSWNDVIKAVPDYATMKDFVTNKKTTGNTQLDMFISDKYGLTIPYPNPNPAGLPAAPPVVITDQASYEAFLHDAYNRLTWGYSLQPGDALWLEGDGRYQYADNPQGPRGKALMAAVYTHYWDMSSSARSSIQLRYESGWDWTSNQKIDRLFVNLGLNF